MDKILFIYNSLTRKKEKFIPITPGHVGLYVCGPTVYGDAHLGHARPAITFDLLYRYLLHLDFKVRYVRNITDVGHLENDADEGEDKILKKARLESLEPMEIVQYYSNSYHHNMRQLNTLSPNIEPLASGHIIEQQLFIDRILKSGYAYEVNGSIYFDVKKYDEKYNYGKLSGRKLDDLISNTRELEGQSEKKNPFDFALWKKATPGHIMHWPSKWSEGYPGWHLECSTMSTKYLGEEFDIHGGGLDLLFPHHECEIAQSTAATGKSAVHYWMHNNMITLNGQKMGKSLGNAVTLNDFFAGTHSLLEKAYSPMTVRFFILQAHYRSTLDFSNQALQASEKGMERLLSGVDDIEKIHPSEKTSIDLDSFEKKLYDAMNDDMNSPILISYLFEGIKTIRQIVSGAETIRQDDLERLRSLYHTFVFDILGMQKLKDQKNISDTLENELIQKKIGDDQEFFELIETILQIRQEAKEKKDFVISDLIRDTSIGFGVVIKDKKDGFEWEFEKKYAFMLGSNMFVDTKGIITIIEDGKQKDFFRIRNTFKVKSTISFLSFDCDIKDSKGQQEIKIVKNKPVIIGPDIKYEFEKTKIVVKKGDFLILKIEQINSNDAKLPNEGPIPKYLKKNPVTAIIRITGNFYAGPHYLEIDESKMKIDGKLTFSGNLSIGTKGIFLTPHGFRI